MSRRFHILTKSGLSIEVEHYEDGGSVSIIRWTASTSPGWLAVVERRETDDEFAKDVTRRDLDGRELACFGILFGALHLASIPLGRLLVR